MSMLAGVEVCVCVCVLFACKVCVRCTRWDNGRRTGKSRRIGAVDDADAVPGVVVEKCLQSAHWRGGRGHGEGGRCALG